MYADGLCLISLSSSGIQHLVILIDTTYTYDTYDTTYTCDTYDTTYTCDTYDTTVI